jgi:excisionase family DNA binding protein
MKVFKSVFESLTGQKTVKKEQPEPLMTPQETAAYLRCSVPTLYGFTSQRKIPYHKVGRMLRFKKSELDAWSASYWGKGRREVHVVTCRNCGHTNHDHRHVFEADQYFSECLVDGCRCPKLDA